jgi:glycosidase
MSRLADTLSADALYPHPERLVTFLGNHDTTRILTHIGSDAPASEALVRLGFVYVMTTRGMPQIYSGDEIAMPGGEDPDDRHDFPGGFPGDTPSAFTAATRTPAQQEMFSWVAQLSSLRSKHDALACGAEQVLAANDDWMVYLRDASRAVPGTCGTSSAAKPERILVAIHRAPQSNPHKPATLDVKLPLTWMYGCKLAPAELATGGATASISDDVLHLQFNGNDALIAPCQ